MERVGILVIILDGDVFTLDETMLMEVVTCLLIAGAVLIGVDHPGCPAKPASTMDQNAMPLTLIGPDTEDPAKSPPLRPLLLLQVPLLVERRGEFIAVP